MKKYVIGADVGGTAVKFGLFTSEGDLEDRWDIPTRTERGGVLILDDIAAAVDRKLAEAGIAKRDVEGIGIGVPGPVRPDGTVSGCVNLGWRDTDVKSRMSSLTGMKTEVGNDADLAALGEAWKGCARGFENVVMVTLGTGIGGGIIVGGRILEGAGGAAGEIGHIPVREDETEACGCGKKGCLEQYASAGGIVRTAKSYIAGHPDTYSSLAHRDMLTAKELFEEAKKGDKAALYAIEETGHILGRTLAGVACVVDPEIFVIGGGISLGGDILIDAIRRSYRQHAFYPTQEAEFRTAGLGNDAGIYGAARLLLMKRGK